MSKITWDNTGERFYETGVSNGVLYPLGSTGYETGVAWNGLTAVNESPEGAEANPQYADNIKYVNLIGAENFNCTIEAFTYPDEFGPCDGFVELAPGVSASGQARKPFGFSYQTRVGNDVEGVDLGYKIHLVYGAQAQPSEKSNASINESPEAMTMSWECSTTPAPLTGHRPTAHLIVDSRTTEPADLAALELLLYGGTEPENTPRLPLPDEVVTLVGTP